MKPEKSFTHTGMMLISGLLLLNVWIPGAFAEHDTALRTDLNFSYNFNRQFRAVSYVFFQADDEMSILDYTEWGIGLRYQTSLPWLSFLIYYQQGYTKGEDRRWRLEQKPSVNLNLQATFLAVNFSNQLRYEYRITPDWNDFRIKNTFEITHRVWMVEPCISWELFYENYDKAIMLNRIKFGINHDVGNHVSLGPYFRMDFSNVNRRWEWTRQLIGFHVTFRY